MHKRTSKSTSKSAVQLRKTQFIAYMSNNSMHIGNACASVGIDRSSYHIWMNTDPEFKEKITSIREALLDDAEHQLFRAVNNGSRWAVEFALKHLGKERGYIQENKFISVQSNQPALEPHIEIVETDVEVIETIAPDAQIKN